MADNGRGRGRARGRARGDDIPAAAPVRQPGPIAGVGTPRPMQQQQPGLPAQSAWGRAARPAAPEAPNGAAQPAGPAPVQQMAALNLGGGNGANGNGGEKPGSSAGRGASRGGRTETREKLEIVRTRPEIAGFTKRGDGGQPVKVLTNYFALQQMPNMNLLQYRVDFDPEEDRIGVRKALLRNHEAIIGTHLFDGTIMYSARRLQNEVTELFSQRASDGQKIRITLRFTKELNREDAQFMTIANIIQRRSTALLGLKLLGRDYFDDQAKNTVKLGQAVLEVWPGYKTAIRAHEEKPLMVCDILHKVLRKDTAYNVFIKACQEASQRNRDIKMAVKAALEGSVVITFYNRDKTYRIDDIDFDKTPMSKFHLRKENRDVTYKEYYKMKYNLDVTVHDQPLLISKPTRRDLNRGDAEPVLLVPELCFMTGLSEDMRKDFSLMKAVGQYTRETPDQRVQQLMRYQERLRSNPEIQQLYNNWGFQLSRNLETCDARRLGPETIITGSGTCTYREDMGDWSRELQSKKLAVTVPLNRWAVLCPGRIEKDGRDFVSALKRVAGPLGMTPTDPDWISLQSDRPLDFTRELKNVAKQQYSIVVCLLFNPNEATYAAIKKYCYVEAPMLNQVVTKKAMSKGLSAATKIAMQMATKLGGEPWRVQIPAKDLMVIGFDVHHDNRQKKSVGAFVYTTNEQLTNFANSVFMHENGEELSRHMEIDMIKALTRYMNNNQGRVPGKIVFYRDAMGAGDIHRIREHEVAALKRGMETFAKQNGLPQRPKLVYVVVTKRINTRFFEPRGQGYANPVPGTVVDNVVTLWERYDFFLVSQKANQGTVSPTSYHIVEDEVGWKPAIHQKLAYKLTHLYYNWSGTLSVPAPIQYAHKCAYQVGEMLKACPHADLEQFPYYL